MVDRHGGGLNGRFTQKDAVVRAQQLAEQTKERAVKKAQAGGGTAVDVRAVDPYEYRLTIACGYRQASEITGTEDAGSCEEALTACRFRTPPSDGPLYLIWQRPKKPAGQQWQLAGDVCRLDTLPASVPRPPAVPSLRQIQNAFRALPFSTPTVSTQPAGNVTLVNLPTYYQATWPGDSGLQPGETSRPVQLLTWSVEFRIVARSYDFHFGDGTTSGEVADAGGVFPDGAIRHTFTQPREDARVTVDAKLTGQFRANGGDWIDIDTVADLQDEPVTILQVKEARARLVTR
jgi:hypothetical protein